MAKAKAPVENTTPPKQSIGDMIDELESIAQKRIVIAAQDKPLKEQYDALKEKILAALDETKQLGGRGKTASVKINETEVPVIKERDKLFAYIWKKKLFHLFLAQPLTTPAWREAKGLNGADLPGTETFTKRDISRSSLKG